MRKNFFIFLTLALVLIMALFIAKEKPNKTVVKPNQAKVKVAYKKSLPSFPFFVGLNQGFFTKRGIEIEPIAFESTNQMIEALIRGDVDATAVGSIEPALAAESVSPGNFKFYGQVQWTKDNFIDYMLVKRDSKISEIKQLSGKKIGVAPGGASVIYAKLFLMNFLNPDETQIEQLDNKILIQALETGAIDAIIGNEPLRTISIEKGMAKILLERPYTDFVPYVAEIAGVGLLSSKFIQKQPNDTKQFIAAMRESFEFGNLNPEKAKSILPSCCGVSEEIALKIPHLGIYSDAASIDKDVLQKFADFLFERKILDKKLDTNSLLYLP